MTKSQLRKRRRAYLRPFFRGNLWCLAVIVLYSMLLTVSAGLMVSWLLQIITDVATGANTDYTIGQLIGLCILDAGFVTLSYWLARLSKPRFLARAIGQYREYVFQKLAEKGISAFSTENTSFYLSALSNDANTIETDFLANLTPLLEETLTFFGSLALMLWYSPLLTAVGIALALLPAVASLAAGNRVAEAEKKVSQQNANYVSSLADCLSGFSIIKSFRAERAMCRQISQRICDLTAAKIHRRKTAIGVQCLGVVAGQIAQLGVFVVGAALALHGQSITAGTLIAFVNLMNYVASPIGNIPQYLAQIKASLVLIDQLADALEQNVRDTGTVSRRVLTSGITLQHLSFSYDNTPVLHDISFTFEQGKRYAIVGASGSGKSTLLHLLMGSHASYGGTIFYDDAELRQLSSDSLYDLVSLVQQSVFIFQASIRDNITMFSPFSSDQVDQAIARSGLTPLVAQRGEDYLCGENGSGLSGGEKQRISIARSLLKNSQVLLFDEATAALDPQTAFQVTSSLLEPSGPTRIVVTHNWDEALLRQYDCIIALKNGTIAEAGTFQSLMERKSYFYSLFTVSQ